MFREGWSFARLGLLEGGGAVELVVGEGEWLCEVDVIVGGGRFLCGFERRLIGSACMNWPSSQLSIFFELGWGRFPV